MLCNLHYNLFSQREFGPPVDSSVHFKSTRTAKAVLFCSYLVVFCLKEHITLFAMCKDLVCECSRLSSLFVARAGIFSRETFLWKVPSGEERWETDTFAGSYKLFFQRDCMFITHHFKATYLHLIFDRSKMGLVWAKMRLTGQRQA